MAKVLREATLYQEDKSKNNGSGVNVLTRGINHRGPNFDLYKKKIDIFSGHFYVANLPDVTKHNEAYLEINVITKKGHTEIPYSFKFETDVRDHSFSANIQGVEMLTNVELIGTGIECQIRLTEIDKIDQKKFQKIKGFVENSDLPTLSQSLRSITNIPLNISKDTIKVFFDTIELLDFINDDDRVWMERPKLELRENALFNLYDGWYAMVTTPDDKSTLKAGKEGLPEVLYEVGGRLYKKYQDSNNYEEFNEETYFTWQIIPEYSDKIIITS